jgi:C1A family cysteine protease
MSGPKPGLPKNLSIYKGGNLHAPASVKAPKMTFTRAAKAERVDLRDGCSPVEDQKTLGSCNACSITGALEYLLRKEGDTTDLSILYTYYNARRISGVTGTDFGCIPAHAAAGVMAFGACRDDLWPYDIAMFTQEPSPQCYENAHFFEAVSYARLESYDEVKVSLSNGIPVIIGTDIPKAYYDAAMQSGVLPKWGAVIDVAPFGHSMLFVGYDEADQVWIVRNSWGADYGDKGYVRIPYDLVEHCTPLHDIWVIGKLEQRGALQGPSKKECLDDTLKHAAEQQKEALDKLREDLRKDIASSTASAKASIRDRLRGPGT